MILWYRCISQPHHGNQWPHGNLYPSPPTPPCQECPTAPPPATGNAITPILTDTNPCKSTAPTTQDPGKPPLEFGGIILILLAVAAVTIMGCTGCVFFFRSHLL
ncbi:unnamed protein product [Lepidochelys olivacea]